MKSLRVTRALTLCALCSLLALSTHVHADTFTCKARDVGCLIASIAKSNANGPEHDYLYLERGSYFVTKVDNTAPDGTGNGLPVVTGALTIVGAGQGVTLIARTPSSNAQGVVYFRLFDVASTGGLTIAYTTISHGSLGIQVGHAGGCVRNSGSLMLYHSTVRECLAWVGGAMNNNGQMTLESATILNNKADFWGGAFTTGPATTVRRSWIGNNKADDDAGISCEAGGVLTIERSVIDSNTTNVVQNYSGAGGIGGDCTMTITQSLVSNNVSHVRGGGIQSMGGQLTITNSTLWGNKTRYRGGAAFIGQQSTATLRDVAVLYNEADRNVGGVSFGAAGVSEGGGLYMEDGATTTLERGWILWNEAESQPDCVGDLTVTGWAVIGDPGAFHALDADPCTPAGVQ